MTEFKQELLPLVPHLRAFARGLCRDRDWADDLVQETILKAWANRASYEPQSKLKAWLFTILRHQFYNELRKRRRTVEVDGDQAAFLVGVPESQSVHLHLKDVASAIDGLAHSRREALGLICIDGVSYIDAAKRCGCPVGTIKSRVARARRELEDIFSEPGARRLPAILNSAAAPHNARHRLNYATAGTLFAKVVDQLRVLLRDRVSRSFD